MPNEGKKEKKKKNECSSLARNPRNLDVVHLLGMFGLEVVLIFHFLQICLNNEKIIHHREVGANFIYSIFFQLDDKPLKISILGIMGILCIFHDHSLSSTNYPFCTLKVGG